MLVRLPARVTESKSNLCSAWITCWIIPFSRFLFFHRELWSHESLFKWNGYVRARSSVHERDEEDSMNTVSTLRNSIAVLVEADKSEQKFRRSIPLWLCYIVCVVQIGQLQNIDTLRYDQKRPHYVFLSIWCGIAIIFSHSVSVLYSLSIRLFYLCVKLNVSFVSFSQYRDHSFQYLSWYKYKGICQIVFFLFFLSFMIACRMTKRVTSNCRDIRKRTWYVDPNNSL